MGGHFSALSRLRRCKQGEESSQCGSSTYSTTSRPKPARPTCRRGVPSTRSLPRPRSARICAAGAVAAPFGQRVAGRGRGRLGVGVLGADARQQRVGVGAVGQQHQRAAAFGGDRREHVADRRAEVGAAPVQRVGQRILHVHAHQRRRVGVGLAAHQREMQRRG